MAKPVPSAGLVIRYDYLWVSEEARGREEGAKVRACAVVVAMPPTGTAPQRALLCGITHSEPALPDEGIEVPIAVKRHLGLDDERSWIITSELNIVDWDDPGIVPVAPGQWAHGFLPPMLAEQIKAKALARLNAKKLSMVDRPQIEKKRAERGSGN